MAQETDICYKAKVGSTDICFTAEETVEYLGTIMKGKELYAILTSTKV